MIIFWFGFTLMVGTIQPLWIIVLIWNWSFPLQRGLQYKWHAKDGFLNFRKISDADYFTLIIVHNDTPPPSPQTKGKCLNFQRPVLLYHPAIMTFVCLKISRLHLWFIKMHRICKSLIFESQKKISKYSLRKPEKNGPSSQP